MKKLLLFFKKPNVIFGYIIFLLAIASIISCFLLMSYAKYKYQTYIIYFIAATLTAYAIYLSPHLFFSTKKWLISHKYTRKFIEDYKYRSQILTVGSMVINFGYAVFECVFAIFFMSIWYGALSAYHFILSMIRFILLYVALHSHNRIHNDQMKMLRRVYAYRRTGILLMILDIALTLAVVQMILYNRGYTYNGILIYGYAVFAFYKMTLAILNIIKSHKYENYIVQALRNISFQDALVSLLALQTALLLHLNANDTFKYNCITGSIVCFIEVMIGIAMIVRGTRVINVLSTNMTIDNME